MKTLWIADLWIADLSAGGPGSGRHKELFQQKHQSEDKLALRRKLGKEQRDANVRQGKSATGRPILSDKARLAKSHMVLTTKEHQDKAEEVERLLAKKTGFTQSSNNKPFDLFGTNKSGKNHAVEVKTMLMQHNDKITMKRNAMNRKTAWAKENKATPHTVVLDLRGPKPVVYHKQGVGSFRLGSMQPVKGGLNGLKNIFA